MRGVLIGIEILLAIAAIAFVVWLVAQGVNAFLEWRDRRRRRREI
jgi:hypothetical protein